MLDSHTQAEQEEWAAQRQTAAAEAATLEKKLCNMQAESAASRHSQVRVLLSSNTCMQGPGGRSCLAPLHA